MNLRMLETVDELSGAIGMSPDQAAQDTSGRLDAHSPEEFRAKFRAELAKAGCDASDLAIDFYCGRITQRIAELRDT